MEMAEQGCQLARRQLAESGQAHLEQRDQQAGSQDQGQRRVPCAHSQREQQQCWLYVEHKQEEGAEMVEDLGKEVPPEADAGGEVVGTLWRRRIASGLGDIGAGVQQHAPA